MAHSSLTLDLRSYSGETRVHQHDFHQLVLLIDEGYSSIDFAMNANNG